MRRLSFCLVMTLLVLTACDKKKAPTEYGVLASPASSHQAALLSSSTTLTVRALG